MSHSTRIQVRFPGIVWDAICAVSTSEGIPPTMWVIRSCVDRLEGQDAYVAPGSTIDQSELLDPHAPLTRR